MTYGFALITFGIVSIYSGFKGVSIGSILKGVTTQDQPIKISKAGGDASSSDTGNANGTDSLGGGTGSIVDIGKVAQDRFHLHVSGQSHFGGRPSSGHKAGSWHYKDRAIDASGNESNMQAFAKWVEGQYGSNLLELIHNPGFSVKNGHHVPPSFWGADTWAGHRNHVHVAI